MNCSNKLTTSFILLIFHKFKKELPWKIDTWCSYAFNQPSLAACFKAIVKYEENSFIIFSYSLFRRLYVIHQLYDVSINHPHNQPSSYIKNAHGKNNSRSRGHCMQKYFSTTFKVNYVVRFTTLLRIFELNHNAECRSNVII